MNKKQKRWTESDVYAMLEKAFPGPAYAMLSQVRNGTGFSRRKNRTADAVAISCYPSRGLHMAGIEIKVARSDWLKEMADPTKADAIQKYCKYWYVAAPKGLIEVGEVPETWGLIECSRGTRIVKAAPALTPVPPDMLLVCSILRNAATSMVPFDQVKKLAQELAKIRVENDLEIDKYELKRLRESVKEFEESAGMKIGDRWDAGPIGMAVKVVRSMGSTGALVETKRLRDQHADLAKRLTNMIEITEGK